MAMATSSGRGFSGRLTWTFCGGGLGLSVGSDGLSPPHATKAMTRATTAERENNRVADGSVPREVRVDIRGGRLLSLIVEDGGDGIEWDYADWCEPRVIVSPDAEKGEEEPSDASSRAVRSSYSGSRRGE